MIKPDDFTTHIIDKWDKLEDYNNANWIYRGQQNSTWTFKSSLERLCKAMKITPKQAYIVERTLTSEFKRRFHQYSKYTPDRHDNLEWLSIMRHYMAPTRLLDWNYSIYIATYFALEGVSGNKGAAVWALNGEWAKKESKKEFLKNRQDKEDIERITDKLISRKYASSFKKLFLVKPFTNTACPICPNRLNQRLSIQKGLFLCPGNPNVSFDANIEAMDGFGDKDNIIRLIIPHQKRKEYLAMLYNINITRASLFPGLDGFAYSLNVYHYSFEKDVLKKNLYKTDDSVWTL